MPKTVQLKSKCNVKGSEGVPGDTVTFSDEALADRIIAGGGGVEVEPPPKPEKKKSAAKKPEKLSE